MLYETKFLVALGATVTIEIPVVLVLLKFVLARRMSVLRIVGVAFLASVLTLPYLWFILPPYVDARLYQWIGEILVVLAETLVYWRLLKIRLSYGLLTAVVANLLSFFIGPHLLNLF